MIPMALQKTVGPDAPALRTVTVTQGDVEVSQDPGVRMSTILGSCVAVCMWDPMAKIGGMNHFLLADGGGKTALKYGANAMELLINRLLRKGARRSTLQSKLFGGASISSVAHEIGQRNGEFAREFVLNEGIPCIAESLGGNKARRVQFNPVTGAARVLFVQSADVAPIRPPRVVPQPDVTLF